MEVCLTIAESKMCKRHIHPNKSHDYDYQGTNIAMTWLPYDHRKCEHNVVRLQCNFNCLHFAQYVFISQHGIDCKQTWFTTIYSPSHLLNQNITVGCSVSLLLVNKQWEVCLLILLVYADGCSVVCPSTRVSHFTNRTRVTGRGDQHEPPVHRHTY